VIHQEFEALAATNPLAAYNVLIQEARAFFEELPARDRERQEELQQRAQQRKKRPTDLDSHYAKRRRQAAPDAAQQGLLF
jgi:septal ring factor EnvC (AmiA/AmiB activator)